MRRSVGKGFALIELLMVVATVAVLAAILLPAFARARNTACAAPCASNLRQIARAFAAYLDDNDGTFPPCGLAAIQSLDDLDTFGFVGSPPI
jgi:prepilin-type N-terminal cleavage/methylation domain-containing protein